MTPAELAFAAERIADVSGLARYTLDWYAVKNAALVELREADRQALEECEKIAQARIDRDSTRSEGEDFIGACAAQDIRNAIRNLIEKKTK